MSTLPLEANPEISLNDAPVRRLKVAFLVGADNASTRQSIEAVCGLTGIQPVVVLIDIAHPNLRKRLRYLRRNVRRQGFGYVLVRALRGIREVLETRAESVIPRDEVDALLRRAFPERNFSLDDLGRRYHVDICPVRDLNSAEGAACLRESGAELGVVLGTQILKRSTFGIPELGCINLHKGKVPEYRGMPPGFWELYERESSAGVTVHFVDDGLDTGDVLGTATVPIHRCETPETLRTKLNDEGTKLLRACVRQLQTGTADPQPQARTQHRPRTKPTRFQEAELAQRLPAFARRGSDIKYILKTSFYLVLFYTGIRALVQAMHSRSKKGYAAIVLYHRVNDTGKDTLTASVRCFAEHVVMFRRYYHVVTTQTLVESLHARERPRARALVLHFDDCYRDVYTDAARILQAAGMPGAMFISTGFVDTDRVFRHDEENYPYRFENLRHEEVAGLIDRGLELGAHTVNHANLGASTVQEAIFEVLEGKRQLEELSGRKVNFFSFPFGKRTNLRPEVAGIVQRGGFSALFSAYGGFITRDTDPMNVPRIGASSDHRALDMMIELEGISLNDLARRWHGTTE